MVTAVQNVKSAFNTVTCGIKKAYNTIAGDFMVLTIIVSSLIKGGQGVGIFSTSSDAVKQALAGVSAAANAFESIKSTVEAVSVYNNRSKLFERVKKINPSLSEEERIANLTEACTHIRDNSKTLHKTLRVVKSVKLGERAEKILKDVTSEDKEIRKAALKKGEEFTNTIRRRINTQFGFALANIVTRVSGLAISIVLIITAANPVTLTLTGVVGLSILAVVVAQKIMLPENPFDEPDKSSKFYTAVYKIRQAAYNAVDRAEAFFNRPKPAALAAAS